MCMVYDTINSSFTPVMSRLLNVMSDGRIEFRTEGRQIYRYRFLNVNMVHFIVYLYIPISKAKMNFNVQYIVNRKDSILFAANIQLVDENHWYVHVSRMHLHVYNKGLISIHSNTKSSTK